MFLRLKKWVWGAFGGISGGRQALTQMVKGFFNEPGMTQNPLRQGLLPSKVDIDITDTTCEGHDTLLLVCSVCSVLKFKVHPGGEAVSSTVLLLVQ